MEKKLIQKLLDKYFEGQTSLEEEKVLHEYFRGPDVDEAFWPFQPLFRYFEAERSTALSEDFEERLLSRLGSTPRIARLRPRLRRWLQAAAAAVLILAAGWWLIDQPLKPRTQTAIDWSKYEVQDPERALEETKKALMLVSAKLEEASSETSRGVQKMRKVADPLN